MKKYIDKILPFLLIIPIVILMNVNLSEDDAQKENSNQEGQPDGSNQDKTILDDDCIADPLEEGDYIDDLKEDILDEDIPLAIPAEEMIDMKDMKNRIISFNSIGGKANDKNFDNSRILKAALKKYNGTNTIITFGVGVYEFKTPIYIHTSISNVSLMGLSVGESYGNGTILRWTGNGILLTLKGLTNSCMSNFRVLCNNNYFLKIKGDFNDSIMQEISVSNALGSIKLENCKNSFLDRVALHIKNENAKYGICVRSTIFADDQSLFITDSNIDGGDIASCNAVNLFHTSRVYIKNSDICNFRSGIGINYKKCELASNNGGLFLDTVNIERCDGGINIQAACDRDMIMMSNTSLIFRGVSAAEQGIVLDSNKPNVFHVTIVGLHTNKLSSVSPEYVFNTFNNSVSPDSFLEIAQNSANGKVSIATSEYNSSSSITNEIKNMKTFIENKEINVDNPRKEFIKKLFAHRYKIKGIYYLSQFENKDSRNDSDIFKLAFNELEKTGGILLVEDGDYICKTALSFDKRVKGIQIYGNENSVIHWTGKGTWLTFKDELWWCKISNLFFKCSSNNVLAFRETAFRSTIENLNIVDSSKAIDIDAVAYFTVENVQVSTSIPGESAMIDVGGDKRFIEFLNIINCSLNGNKNYKGAGISLNSGTHIILDHVTINDLGKGTGIRVHRAKDDNILLMLYFNQPKISFCDKGIEFNAEDYIGITIINSPKIHFSGDHKDNQGITFSKIDQKTIQIHITDYQATVLEAVQPEYILWIQKGAISKYTSYIEVTSNQTQGKIQKINS